MAFYKSVPDKKKKPTDYAEKGSWDEEGTHYTGARRNGDDRKRSGYSTHTDKPRFARDDRGAKRFGPDRRPDNKPAPAEKRRPRPETAELAPERAVKGYRDFEYRAPVSESVREEENEANNILCGRNPIREALKNGRSIEKILVQKGELNGSAKEIVQTARAAKIMIQEIEKSKMDLIAPHHQGLIAYASAYEYATVEDMLANAEKRGEAPFLILLDGVTDPHNLGAIIRSAECAGAHGVIVPQHRSVGLTPSAIKASAGAIEHMPVAKVTNLNRTIEELKAHNIWVYAVTMNGKDFEKVDFKGGTALVIGAEGEGISRLTEEKCDLSVSLPMKGHIDSLNASVAAGIMMYRVLASRRK